MVHVSHPFIQELRRRFIDEFNAARPRFVIDFQGDDQPRPAGDDTTLEFPELTAILAADYKVRKTGREYKILEREPALSPR